MLKARERPKNAANVRNCRLKSCLGRHLSEVEMKTQEELKKMSFMELNAELQKAVDELGKELKALGILREVEK